MNKITAYKADVKKDLALPFFTEGVKAGFPSPANDFAERLLDLNEYLIPHPAATFFVTAKGDSMVGANIRDGDILVVDRSLTPKNNDIVIACLDGEFTVKKLVREANAIYLVPANVLYKRLKIHPDMNFQVWGVVTYVISKFR